MAVAGVLVTYRGAFRPWMYTWGAGKSEVAAELPGDELAEADAPRTTRAVTIDAPVRAIWPWLVQIGEDRGGFYSYALLEQAVGARIHNAHAIHPEWQDLHVGDTIWLARRYGDNARQVVALLEPESDLVLMSPADFARVQQGEKASGVWSFHLRRSNGWTRLIVRGSGGFVGRPWFDIVHFIMERAMMRGLRARAERTARAEYEHYGEVDPAQSPGMATVTPIP
ncbi:hypothetical protein [Mycolicibacterium brisbanense]|nr:hypothetical protein [Mycolicibacterium brisbanense]MCV7155948.1 hypothetical protein [Mycolicibacterium brisbanense]